MKKRKKQDLLFPDFKNNPFKALKRFTPQPVAAKNKAAVPRVQSEKSDEDDTALFFRAIEGARRIDGAAKAEEAFPKPKSAKKRDAGALEDEGIFLQAMQKIGTTLRAKAPDTDSERSKHRSSSGRMRQLKRGTIRISRELDLHGFLKDEALIHLEQFIASAFNQGRAAVLVITGKGINSPEGPVLPGAVAAWLREKGRGMVAEFSSAPLTLGGSGALVVFLKRK
jgi:DNA-nicking Smr family endonuclease